MAEERRDLHLPIRSAESISRIAKIVCHQDGVPGRDNGKRFSDGPVVGELMTASGIFQQYSSVSRGSGHGRTHDRNDRDSDNASQDDADVSPAPADHTQHEGV